MPGRWYAFLLPGHKNFSYNKVYFKGKMYFLMKKIILKEVHYVKT